MRIIKRYSNRKLYDTTESRYVTLAQLLKLVRDRVTVQVVDVANEGVDLTAETLIKAMEGDAGKFPASGLHRLIREGLAA